MNLSHPKIAICAALLFVQQVYVIAPMYAQSSEAALDNTSAQPAIDRLTDREERKMVFFADKILSEIAKIGTLEAVNANAEIVKKATLLRSLSRRFTASASDAGLTNDEISQYFLNHFSGNYTKPVPSLLTNETGTFDVENLLFGEIKVTAQDNQQSDNYLNQLRIEGNAPSDN